MFHLNDPKAKRLLLAAIIFLSLLLTVLGWLILPDTLVMQISSNGSPSSTLPKAIGLLIPGVICIAFAVLFYRRRDTGFKDTLGILIGLVAYLLIFIFNL